MSFVCPSGDRVAEAGVSGTGWNELPIRHKRGGENPQAENMNKVTRLFYLYFVLVCST